MIAPRLSIDVAELSEKGGRNENQDACGHWSGDEGAYFVLCDGAGGHLGGGVASRLAIDEALGCLREQGRYDAAAIEAALRCANDGLVRGQRENAEHAQMRATIVALALDTVRHSAAWGHIGDSRLYCFRGGRVLTQTRDHSVVQSLVDAGYLQAKDVRTSPDRSKLLSALGDADHFDPAVEPGAFAVKAGDRFLLCSDGLWEYIEEHEMEAVLADCGSPAQWLRALERLVIARGRRRHDNYSALAVWCR